MSLEVVQILEDLNPWWRRPEEDPAPPPYRRPRTKEVFERLRNRGSLIEIVRGPRQVGKTTAIAQIVRDLLDAGVPGSDLFFVRFDHEVLRETPGGLPALIRWHAAEIRRRPYSASRPTFLFLDEIHKLRRWDEQVKHAFDTFPMRLLLTGSSSVLVTKGGRESLAGRALTTDFPTFSFREVLEAWHPEKARSLPEAVRFRKLFDPDTATHWSKGLSLAAQQRLSLQRSLERYYARGGYPRLHSEAVPEDHWADYLVETVFDRVLGVDIPDLFPVEQPGLMRHLYLSVARHTGHELSQVGLAESANAAGYRTNQPTVGKYLHYLADALLVREFKRYPLTRRASTRVPAKLCLSDLGVRNALLRGAPSLGESAPDVVGPLVETVVQSCIRDSNLQVHYYREFENPSNRSSPVREVDFVAEETDGTTVPIEVKFRKSIDGKDSLGLRHFLSKYSASFGILVTRDRLEWDPQERILKVPLLDFLVRLR